MLKIIIGAAALFPWSLMIVVIVGALRRRRSGFAGEYIPAQTHAPILLDSAQVAKALREGRS